MTNSESVNTDPGQPSRDNHAGFDTLWSVLRRRGNFRVGALLVVPLIVLAIFGRLVAPFDPTELSGLPYASPGSDNWLGTDALGRDVLSRVLYGGWTLTWQAFVATVLGVGLGALCGGLLAYTRGWIEEACLWITDAWLSFPLVVLALLLMSIVGPSSTLLVAVVAAGHLPRTLRLGRAAGLAVVNRDFIRYSETIGERRLWVISREILPNLSAPLTVEFGVRFTWSIAALASLSFLGMGVQPPVADWGLMIKENFNALQLQPWAVLAPLIAIGALSAGVMLMVDAVARAVTGIASTDR